MNQYTVQFYRDEEGWWVARVTGLRGVHSQGRSIEEARRHVREALSLVVGDKKARSANFCEKIHLPAEIRRCLSELQRRKMEEANATSRARKAAEKAAQVLTRKMQLSLRDAAALTGFSFQRIQQLLSER